ncbi:MAG: UvrD-helicase domain-containing protein, partial [Chloroflexota bacterium]
MPDESRSPADQCARDKASRNLGKTLFVEAGAGTGKTTVLVERVLSLLRSGAKPESLAIITFTRAAASELQERIRGRVEQALAEGKLEDAERVYLLRALDDLDFAAIQTIDSFALSLLRERPLEAGLPPVIEPLDEVDSVIEFDERWAEWLDGELGGDEDTDLAGWLERAMRLGMSNPLSTMKDIARRFHENHDVIRGLDLREPYRSDVDVVGEMLLGGGEVRRLAAYCKDPADNLYQHIQGVLPFLDELADIPDATERHIRIVEGPTLKCGKGKKENWPDPEGGKGATCINVVRDKLSPLQELKNTHAEAMRAEALGELANAVAGFVLEYEEERRAEGRAEFHDMLVWAAKMLENKHDALRHFQQRYDHILIDEFQDTDPLQVKLAFLLTCRSGAQQPDPGALFVVGDPKQSIYGWRRADIQVMNEARKQMTGGGDPVRLTQNFRSHRRLIDWVNGVFQEWIGTEESEGQAEYVCLETDLEPPAPDWGAFHIGGPVEEANAQG